MDKWPEDRIAVFCGRCDFVVPTGQCKVAQCTACGCDVWLSLHTEPTLKKFIESHSEVTGFDCVCKDCAEKLFGHRKDEVEIIDNPHLQNSAWN